MTESVVYVRDEVTPILVPTTIEKRIKARLPNTDFQSVNDYASYVLDQVLHKLESEDAKYAEQQPESAPETEPTPGFSQKDQEDVEQRLRDLGYL